MDKDMQKRLLRDAGVPVVRYCAITRDEYRGAMRLAEVAGLHRLEWRGPRWFLAVTE
jgi:D-alanine-D-alanine ligase-like ATP-grasp enzyme